MSDHISIIINVILIHQHPAGVDPTLRDLDQLQLVSFIQSFGIPVDSMTKLLQTLDQAVKESLEAVNESVLDKVRKYWAIPQYPGHLHREILIFWQKSLWTIHTYHLVPFKLPKNVQRGPFQGLLVLKYFFQKISNFTNYALTPTF